MAPIFPPPPIYGRPAFAEGLGRISDIYRRDPDKVRQNVDALSRALAGACARNPIPIIVPCHRVVARTGGLKAGLGGYSGAGGLEAKRFLLALEDRVRDQAGLTGAHRE